MPSAKLVFGFTAIATALMAPGLALAQTCSSNADCAKGLICQADATTTTPVAICYDGDAGGACTPVGNPPALVMRCQLAPCATVADCGPDMVCDSHTVTSCPTSPGSVKCDPTTGCDAGAPDPVACTDTISSLCAYKWQLPCNADADCGAGFTCQPSVMGICSGSSGSAPNGGTGTASAGTGGGSGSTGVPAPLPVAMDAGTLTPVTCQTITSFPGSCQPKATTCAVNTDCPSVWTCVASNVGTAVSGGTATGGTATSGGSAPVALPDGGAPVVVPPPVTTTVLTCQPPYSATGSTTHDSGSATAIKSGDAGAVTGSTTPPVPATPGNNGGPTTPQTAATTGSGGGCSLAASQPSSGTVWLLGLLAVLGLALARRGRMD